MLGKESANAPVFRGYKNAKKVGIIKIVVECCKTKLVYASSLENDKSMTIGNHGMTITLVIVLVLKTN